MIWHATTLLFGFMVGYFVAALLSANARMHMRGDDAAGVGHPDFV